jgi:hypothetical protein
MYYRTGTYVAFDGLGEENPSMSDFKYYATLQAWDANKDIDFKLTNSHEKTYAVRDDSLLKTLKERICERLSKSKNMIVVLSEDTRKSGSMLSFEIEKAVDVYKLPLIIAYPGFKRILNVESHRPLWPTALIKRIDNGTARAIHVPFKKDPILDAIGQFTVQNSSLTTGMSYYNLEAYRAWGLYD